MPRSLGPPPVGRDERAITFACERRGEYLFQRPSEYPLALSKRLTPTSKQIPMRPRASSTYVWLQALKTLSCPRT